MKDVEELLRETLSDPRHRLEPSPELYGIVRRRAAARRRTRWAAVSAGVAVIAVAVAASTLAVHQSGHRTPTAHTPSPSSTPSPTLPRPSESPHGAVSAAIDVGQGWPSEAVMAAGALYVLTNNPSQLVVLNAAGTNIKATADLPTTDAAGLTVGDGRVWVWTESPGVLYAYDASTLQSLGSFPTGAQVFNVSAVDGELYLATDRGLLLASGSTPSSGRLATTSVAGIAGGTYGLAADPVRHRVLVGVTPLGSAPANSSAPANGFVGVRVVAVDARTGKVVAQSPQTSVGKESIAVVGDQVWIGGYGDTDKPRIEHLDATTLRVTGTSPVGAGVGPGAILWPGSQVLWVRNGGDEGLSCVDPKSGAILEQWLAVQGPVTSVPGHAYGVQAGLQPLGLNASCPG